MPEKLLIIVSNTVPNHAQSVGVPFFQATVAAAMEYDVEIILTGRSTALATKYIAKEVSVGDGNTLQDLFQSAKEAGVYIKLCELTNEPLPDQVPEISEIVGHAYLIQEAMRKDVVVLNY